MLVQPHDHFDSVYLANAIGQLVTQLSNLSHTLEVPAEFVWEAVGDHQYDYFPNPIISNVARGTVRGLVAIYCLQSTPHTSLHVAWEEITTHPNYDSWKELT